MHGVIPLFHIAQPVTLAGRKRAKSKARNGLTAQDKTIIPRVIAILEAGQSSKFQFEGACRHGLRSSFCLAGIPWPKADARASAIVTEALRRIAAERPTWQMAQPECTADGFAPIERTRCVKCGNPISDDRHSLGGPAKYCSPACRAAARSAIVRKHGYQMGRAEFEAMQAARRQDARQHRGQPCGHCGTLYVPTESPMASGRTKKFCSRECYQAALAPRPCTVCGAVFAPDTDPKASYCSPACNQEAYRARRQAERPFQLCEVCGSAFRPFKPTSRTCSRQCANTAKSRRRWGKPTNGFRCEAAE